MMSNLTGDNFPIAQPTKIQKPIGLRPLPGRAESLALRRPPARPGASSGYNFVRFQTIKPTGLEYASERDTNLSE
eukprot:scaffold17006_cov138-Skeletonema_dohrnii-CCMP3373.AAC.2